MTKARSKGNRASVWYNLAIIGLLTGLAVGTAGCSDDSGDISDEGGDVTLNGIVIDTDTGLPIRNAFVRFQPPGELVETGTDGTFTYTTFVDSATTIRVTAQKDGYSAAGAGSVDVTAIGGRTVDVPALELRLVVETAQESGLPSNINLVSVTPNVIGIKESGSPEVAAVRYVLTDSTGIPVSRQNGVEVRFTLGEQPGGGEFIFPESAFTDPKGQVVVNLSSGIRAGAVQIVAEATVGDNELRSLPVTVAIHGGLPDQTHFSLGPARFNFPGLLRYGITNQISVIVGDKYSNPVKPQTAVYFSTTHGVIEGSILTNAQGRGTVDLISANPLPADGVSVISASTADDVQVEVSDLTPVLFSGVPVVTVSPTIAALDTFYDLTVTDQNGNPLVQGTRIQAIAQGRFVTTVGNNDVTLDDTIFTGLTADDIVKGPGITEFQFGVIEDIRRIGESGTTELGAVIVRVRGGNGAVEIVLLPDGRVMSPTDGVSVEMHGDKAVFRVEKPNF